VTKDGTTVILKVVDAHYRVTIPILSILRSTNSTACHLAPLERAAELSCGHIGHTRPIHCWNLSFWNATV